MEHYYFIRNYKAGILDSVEMELFRAWPSPPQFKEWFKLFRESLGTHSQILVALDEKEKIIGGAGIKIRDKDKPKRKSKEIILMWIFVIEEYRRQGLATRMLKQVQMMERTPVTQMVHFGCCSSMGMQFCGKNGCRLISYEDFTRKDNYGFTKKDQYVSYLQEAKKAARMKLKKK